jgi:hypothetical protein
MDQSQDEGSMTGIYPITVQKREYPGSNVLRCLPQSPKLPLPLSVNDTERVAFASMGIIVRIILGLVLFWLLWRSRRFRIGFAALVLIGVGGYWLNTHMGPQPNIRVLTIGGHKCWSQEGYRDPGTPDDSIEATGLPYCYE